MLKLVKDVLTDDSGRDFDPMNVLTALTTLSFLGLAAYHEYAARVFDPAATGEGIAAIWTAHGANKGLKRFLNGKFGADAATDAAPSPAPAQGDQG